MPKTLRPHLESKTNGGLLLFLAVIVGLALAGKLTPEAVESIKWLGASFFLVRTTANMPIGVKKDADH